MRVKIKPLLNIIGHEELYVIPIKRNGDYLLCLNFYEDIIGGTLARLVIVLDKYNEINSIKVIEGDKGIVEVFGIKEDFDLLKKQIRLPKILVSTRIPFFINIKIKNQPETLDRGITGYLNYVKKYGEIKPLNLNLDLEILV
ncbi:hypothetical protein [Acidianus brierleyi]|uniref:Uncharacterized protein n=1 Tax=Acidianus brierleyi TaxID=41673 RepID=A0A2U9IBJ6_9CREN|nr:hypothetical protein [Acidianus brierleyi]AWR93382.1 hypothetical protein DFR85_00920 [Acidianus brierleyi]